MQAGERSEYLARAAAAVELRERTETGMSPIGTGAAEPRETLQGSVVAIAATSAASFTRLFEDNLLGAGGVTRSVLAIGVAEELGPLTAAFAPLSGMVTVERLRAEAIKRAEAVARHAARSVPVGVAVRHCACSGWRDSRISSILAAHGCQSIVVEKPDLSRRQLRAVRARANQLGVELVLSGGRDGLRLLAGAEEEPLLAGATG